IAEKRDRFDAVTKIAPEFIDVIGARKSACHSDNGNAIAFVPRVLTCDWRGHHRSAVNGCGQISNGRMLKQQRDRKWLEFGLQTKVCSSQRQRRSAQVEETVVNSDTIDAQQSAPNSCDRDFRFRAWWCECAPQLGTLSLRRGQCSPIDFAAGCERQS